MVALKQARRSFSEKLLCVLFAGLFLAFAGSIDVLANPGNSGDPADVQQSKRTVTGVVLDESGQPLIGVSVVVQGTTVGSMTDIDGRFSIEARADQKLRFSYVGYDPVTIDATNTTINITLTENVNVMDDVVVVGFGVQRRENLTGAVSTVDVGKAIDSKPIVNIQKALQGVAPGLTITFDNGTLNSSPTVRLRGAGTIVDGEAAGGPLILVDGTPTDLTMVNPEDVASISVLKDAASASIYGTRAAFGVILITTKTGKPVRDKVTFNYNNNIAYRQAANLIQFVDPETELPIMMAANQRSNGSMSESFGMLHDRLLEGIIRWKENFASSRSTRNKEMIYGQDWEIIEGRAYTYRVWDPHEEMLRNWTPQMTHNLSAQGQLGQNSTFLMSLGYMDQSGFMRIQTDKMKRYNANLSLTTQLATWLKATTGIMYSRKDYREPFNYYNASSGFSNVGYNGYFGYYQRWGMYFPYGTVDGNSFRHAPGYMRQARMNTAQTDLWRLSATLIADITKDLKLNVEYRYTTTRNDMKVIGRPVQLLDFWSGGWDINNLEATALSDLGTASSTSTSNKVAISNYKEDNHLFNIYGTYTKTFIDVHNVKFTAGLNVERTEGSRIYTERRGLMDPNASEITLANGPQYSFNQNGWTWGQPGHSISSIAGYFARANYDYMGKYLLELNGRYDGSSRFPRTDLWAFFPSGSIGYRLTEEPFMQSAKSIANDIKIRASIGSIGNQEVRTNVFRPLLEANTANWIVDGNVVSSVDSPDIVDPRLSWERVITYDVGLDVRFLNNMLGASFDWYARDTKDILAPGQVIPATTGTTAPYTNAGAMRTVGWELTLDFNKQVSRDINLYANFMISDYQTEVTEWDNPGRTLGSLYKGMKLGEIWGYETQGFFTENDLTLLPDGNYAYANGVANQDGLRRGNFRYGFGDVRYRDLDGSGAINNGQNTVDDPGDLRIIGNSLPRYEYSFRIGGSFYNFDLDMFFQGVGKRNIWAASDMVLPMYNRTDALYEKMLDYWTPENPNAFWPNPYNGHATNLYGTWSSGYGSTVTGSNNFITQTKYLLNMAYLRFKTLTVGYTLPVNLTRKAGVDKLRVYFTAENLGEIKDSKLPVDPEINSTEASWGRAYPFPRTLSMGLQVNF